MMGAGKSSVGRCLHRRTGLALHDTDEIVAANFGCRFQKFLPNTAKRNSERAETEALRRMRIEEPTIIITGGGIVLRKKMSRS
jgi:shikimate kinase